MLCPRHRWLRALPSPGMTRHRHRAHTVPQVRGSQQPLLRITNYAIVTHFLNAFALVIVLQQLVGISNPQPPPWQHRGVLDETFPEEWHGLGGTTWQQGPLHWDPALPAASCRIPTGPATCPEGDCPSPPEQPHFVRLQTWPGQECVSARPRFTGCPEALLAWLWHTPGPNAPPCFPRRSLATEPHAVPHQGHPSCGDMAEEPRRVLGALRGSLPALVADREHFGSRMANKVCVGLPGWGNPPGEPKQALVGAWGCGAGGVRRRGRHRHPHPIQEQSGAREPPTPWSCLCRSRNLNYAAVRAGMAGIRGLWLSRGKTQEKRVRTASRSELLRKQQFPALR